MASGEGIAGETPSSAEADACVSTYVLKRETMPIRKNKIA
jgi:hypothetical protein